jgi:hypothetical protein
VSVKEPVLYSPVVVKNNKTGEVKAVMQSDPLGLHVTLYDFNARDQAWLKLLAAKNVEIAAHENVIKQYQELVGSLKPAKT